WGVGGGVGVEVVLEGPGREGEGWAGPRGAEDDVAGEIGRGEGAPDQPDQPRLGERFQASRRGRGEDVAVVERRLLRREPLDPWLVGKRPADRVDELAVRRADVHERTALDRFLVQRTVVFLFRQRAAVDEVPADLDRPAEHVAA